MRNLTVQQWSKHHNAVERILGDSFLTSPEERLFAVILRRELDLAEVFSPTFSQDAAKAIYGNGSNSSWSFRRLLESDIRRYAVDFTREVTCPAWRPRAKRSCGKRSSSYQYVTDPATGERHPFGYCSEHAEEGRKALVAAKTREALADIIPRPYANAGGRVRRHCPETDWETLWRKLDPKWEPPPEREPVVATPSLSVVEGANLWHPSMGVRSKARLHVVT
jgi:hypothetical protein